MIQRHRLHSGILGKLLLTMLVPATLFIAALIAYFYAEARSSLEDEMGRRLVGVARSVTSQMDVEVAMRFAPGDEERRTYRSLVERLRALAEINDAERIYVVTLGHNIICDTDDESSIGQQMYRLAGDRQELKKVAAREAVAATMFRSSDGRFYKAGYAPLIYNGQVVGLVGVDAGVRFFDRLRDTQRNLILAGLVGLLMLAVAVVLFTRRLLRPVRSLNESARRIGEGDLRTPIEPLSSDEIGFLAKTMNQMRLRIVDRDRYLQMLQRGIAHEVRNPIGGMELYCDILADELGNQPALVDHLNKIRNEVRGLDKVVNEFLDFTRETMPDTRSVDVSDFLAELLMVYAGMTESRQVTIEKQVDEKLGAAVFDPDLLRRALHNVLLNAVQAMPDAGELKVNAYREKGDLVMEISDTGKGIPEDIIGEIFTPFVTTKNSGTGLGLPFARKIIESHKGRMELESKPGQGTTVRFTLPQSRTEEKS